MNGAFSWLRRHWVSLSVLAGPVILLGPQLLRGRALVWGTPSMQFIPWWTEAVRQLANGSLPLWNHWNGFGAPLAANYQSAFFYPPNWIFIPLGLLAGAAGIAWGYLFLAMLHLGWAGLGMAALLRRCGAGELAQAVGGAAFAGCGYLVARLEFFSIIWAASWIPWTLRYSCDLAAPVEAIAPVKRFRFSAGLMLSAAMMLLAGHAQLSWYGLLFAGLWVLAGSLRRPWRGFHWPLLGFAVAAMAAAGLAAVQLFPTAEYLSLSQRSAEYGYSEAMTYSFWPWRLVSLLAPDFFGNPGLGDFWGYASYWEDAAYVGMLPFLLALGTLAGLLGRSKGTDWGGRRLRLFLWVMLVFSFVLAMGKNTPVYPFLYRYVPTFNMFQAPARYLIWASLALVLLAGVGVQSWRCPSGHGLYWLRLGTAGAFAVTLGAGLGWLYLREVQLTFVRALALAGLWALGAGGLTLSLPFFEQKGLRGVWTGLVVGWVVLDLLVANAWLNPFVEARLYSGIAPNVAALKEDLAGRRVYLPERAETLLKFRRFFRAGDYRPVHEWRDLRFVLLPNLNILDGVAMGNNFDPLVTGRYARWIDALEWLPTAERDRWLELAGVGAFTTLDVPQPGGVRFERLQAVRRFSLHACPDWVSSEEQELEAYARVASDPQRISLRIDENRPGTMDDCMPRILGWGKLLYADGGKIRVWISAPEPGYLFIDESNFPGWRSKIDEKPVPILRANYLFMAVFVPEGEHEILLEYHPRSFMIGILLSILMALLTIVYLAYQRRRPRDSRFIK